MSSLDEMREAVQQVLADRGILGQLRAQVRAAVFTAVEDEEKNRGIHMENPRLRQLSSSPEGQFLVGLVDEFCAYYGMAFTRSTLVSESSMEGLPERSALASWAGLNDGAKEDRPLLVSLVEAARRAGSGDGTVPNSPGDRSASASFASDGADSPRGGEGAGLGATFRPGFARHAEVVEASEHDSAGDSGSAASPSASPESLLHAVKAAARSGHDSRDGSRPSGSPDFSLEAHGDGSPHAHLGAGPAVGAGKSRTGELGLQIDMRGEAQPGAGAQEEDAEDARPGHGARASSGSAGPDRDSADDEIARMLADAGADEDTAGAGAAWGSAASGGVKPADPPAAPRPLSGLAHSRSSAELPPLPGARRSADPPAVPTRERTAEDEGADAEEIDEVSSFVEDEDEEVAEAASDERRDQEASAPAPAGEASPAADEADAEEEDYADYEDDFEHEGDVDAGRSEARDGPGAAAEAGAGGPATEEDLEDIDDQEFLDGDLDELDDQQYEADLGDGAGEMSMDDSRSLDQSMGHAAAARTGPEVVEGSFMVDEFADDDDLDLDAIEDL